MFFVYPHSDLPAKALQMLNRFDNNGLRSHETRTEFLGNCANMFAKKDNKKKHTNGDARAAFSLLLFCLMWLQLPMLPFQLPSLFDIRHICRAKYQRQRR